MNLDTNLAHFIKIKYKWILYLNVKCKHSKLLEGINNIGESLDNIAYVDTFLDITPKARFMKEIIDILEFIKIKNFCFVKDNVKGMRRQATG